MNVFELLTSSKPVYGESDIEACRRIFGGETFQCRGYNCTAEIEWIGVCDDCLDRITQAEYATDLERADRRFTAIGIPAGMIHCTFDEWEMARSVEQHALDLNAGVNALERWTGRPPLVLIAGPVGTGKTHLAVSALRRFMEINPRKSARFWSEFNFMEAVKQSYDDKDRLLRRLLEIDLLVFDELGTQKITDWSAGTRAGLLNARIDNAKATIVTTNKTHADIQAIDERLASRIRSALVINTSGATDVRGTEKDRNLDEEPPW